MRHRSPVDYSPVDESSMKTVHFNKKAVVAFTLGCTVIFLCTIGYLNSGGSTEEPQSRLVGRDPMNRALYGTERRTKLSGEAQIQHQISKVATRQRIAESVPQMDEQRKENPSIENETNNDVRRNKIVEMMLHAWYGYRNNTWGRNEVRPISKTSNNQMIFGGDGMAATIVDAADTLFIMGLTKEYEQARDFIRDNFDIKKKATNSLSVFETTIRFLGGMLSLYALTGEEFYKTKAQDIGDTLLPAFKTETGIPYSNLNVVDKRGSNNAWANGQSILAEIGTLHLEFVYLSHITNQNIFAKKVKKVRDVLDKASKSDAGLFPNYINPHNGRFSGSHISLGALGDSFYEYLIKSWIQSGYSDEQARRMYWESSANIQEKMVFKSKSSLTYVAELRNGHPEHNMGHLACFVTGMFALEAHYEKDPAKKESTMKLAEEIGRTCHESYIRSSTGIGPEMFYFNTIDDATSKTSGPNGYVLRPEVIEGFFYLWRLTGKTMYREWVWDAMRNIDKYCRKEGGFAGLQNVYNINQGYDDVQQSFFLAETLKYAYLTFTDNDVISLDKWVFNTEAHPLPIMKSEL